MRRVLTALLGLLLAACSAGPPAPRSAFTIEIGVAVPQTGPDRVVGLSVLDGVRYEVNNVWHGRVEGVPVNLRDFDSTPGGVRDPVAGADNIGRLANDSRVLGVIGPLFSSEAEHEIPIANASNLAMVSPAASNECLTREAPGCSGLANDLRPAGPNNFFRVVAADDLAAPAMAAYASGTLKLSGFAVASDGQAYGKALADAFEAELRKRSGPPVLRNDFDPRTSTDLDAFLHAAAGKGAKAVYFGGRDTGGACLARSKMTGVFDASVPFLGGDAILTPVCLRDAAPSAVGMQATLNGVDPDHLTSGMATADAFKAAYQDMFGRYTLPAIDASGVLLAAISRAVKAAGGNLPSKEDVRAQVASTRDYKGALGATTFDARGDTTLKIFSVYTTSGTPVAWSWAAEERL